MPLDLFWQVLHHFFLRKVSPSLESKGSLFSSIGPQKVTMQSLHDHLWGKMTLSLREECRHHHGAVLKLGLWEVRDLRGPTRQSSADRLFCTGPLHPIARPRTRQCTMARVHNPILPVPHLTSYRAANPGPSLLHTDMSHGGHHQSPEGRPAAHRQPLGSQRGVWAGGK